MKWVMGLVVTIIGMILLIVASKESNDDKKKKMQWAGAILFIVGVLLGLFLALKK